MSDKAREEALYSMSYNEFVTEYCGLSQETADAIFTRQPAALIGVTSDSTSLYESLTLPGLPGTHRLGAQGDAIQRELDAMPGLEGHYAPEGNAIIARNLVKRLVPQVAQGETMEELTSARFDYAQLDEETSRNRIRLNSTVVEIKTLGTDGGVAVTYIRGDEASRVRARHCIYAGFHMYLPYLCPELPREQQSALKENVKMPFVAAQVFLRNARPVKELGSASFYFPGRMLHECVVWGRSLGDHEQDYDPDEPAVIYMIGPVVEPHTGLTPVEQHRLGRYKLLSMSFEDYELEVREQLVSLFAGTSFDMKRDLIGLTVNRWPHGYSRQYNTLFDPHYVEGSRPHEVARRRFGPIAVANSDASYVALCNTAIDEGLRAVDELLA
jgi:spermidine dehydrogenase